MPTNASILKKPYPIIQFDTSMLRILRRSEWCKKHVKIPTPCNVDFCNANSAPTENESILLFTPFDREFCALSNGAKLTQNGPCLATCLLIETMFFKKETNKQFFGQGGQGKENN